MTLTSEIDGTAYLADNDGERGVGDVKLELLDEAGKVVATATSAWDGFYVVEAVPPGHYRLRAAPEQLQRLKLAAPPAQAVTVGDDGEFVSGIDIILKRVP